MTEVSGRARRKIRDLGKMLVKEDTRTRYNQVADILKVPEDERSEEQRLTLQASSDVVKKCDKNMKKRLLQQSRKDEISDSLEEIVLKCKQLSDAMTAADSMVVYVGAGISTSALIPDYRGPKGVWTLQNKGLQPRTQDLADSSPTYTHMALSELMKLGHVKYIVSQNCDGLHVRSGVDRKKLSELHGNMFLEVCDTCTDKREYMRLCDVTERTGVRKHHTGRNCKTCKQGLRDTIVHFGEKGSMGSPYNWHEARHAAENADLILCLGTSLKVLRKYSCLWGLNKPVKRRAPLYIVNLQWTPKDDIATLKIHGNCDEVMKLVMQNLHITAPTYQLYFDPLFSISVPFTDVELTSVSKNQLTRPATWDHSYTTPYSQNPTSTNTLNAEVTALTTESCSAIDDGRDRFSDQLPEGSKVGASSEDFNEKLTDSSKASNCVSAVHYESKSGTKCSHLDAQSKTSITESALDCMSCKLKAEYASSEFCVGHKHELAMSQNMVVPQKVDVSNEIDASQEVGVSVSKLLKRDSPTTSSSATKIKKTAPGWYGLGYKKRKRRRKGFLT